MTIQVLVGVGDLGGNCADLRGLGDFGGWYQQLFGADLRGFVRGFWVFFGYGTQNGYGL